MVWYLPNAFLYAVASSGKNPSLNPHFAVIFGSSLQKPVYIAETVVISAL